MARQSLGVPLLVMVSWVILKGSSDKTGSRGVGCRMLTKRQSRALWDMISHGAYITSHTCGGVAFSGRRFNIAC